MKKILRPFFCYYYWQSRCHQLVIIACLFLAIIGQMPESSVGWVLAIESPLVVSLLKRQTKGDKRRRWRHKKRHAIAQAQRYILTQKYLSQTFLIPSLRFLILASLSVTIAPDLLFLSLLPLVIWAGQALAIYCQGWHNLPEWQLAKYMAQKVERVLMLVALLWFSFEVGQFLQLGGEFLLIAGLQLEAEKLPMEAGRSPNQKVFLSTRQNEEGEMTHYTATLSGEFNLAIPSDEPHRLRFLILFLRELEVADQKHVGRQTRDSRSPFVKQLELSRAYHVPQPNISRWEKYWQKADWRRLLSIRAPEILTLEVQERIVSTFAKFPWWSSKKVHSYLHQQGLKVSHHQIKQAAFESGWNTLRGELCKRFVISADSFRPRDEWLMSHLLQKQAELIQILEAGGQLPRQLKVELTDLSEIATEIGIEATKEFKSLPWALRLEQLLFGNWEMVNHDTVCCIYCGSDKVARKSNKPRIKKYLDENNKVQSVEVYRYYCRNSACEKGSFTDLPPHLLPHSPYTLQRHILGLQLYSWAGTNYRRCALALGVSSATVYRWISGCGSKLLPVAALFGVVYCSGAIGIDEKFVLVPKNDNFK